MDKDQETIENEIKLSMKKFLESKPLYVKTKTTFIYYFSRSIADVIELYCKTCKNSRPYRKPKKSVGLAGNIAPPRSTSGIYSARYICSGCDQEDVLYYIYADFDIQDDTRYSDGYVMKIGQYPMWLPTIPKQLKKAFGKDVELYQKALRNMNEGYGIGACAYLRRLIEKYINPLLTLLHDVKQQQGEPQEKLDEIKEVIEAKDFTSKTRYASEIAPSILIIEGHNPLKEIHERLSVGLHNLDDEAAIQYASVIKEALEFIIPRLRREYEERKEYANKIKEIRKLSVK